MGALALSWGGSSFGGDFGGGSSLFQPLARFTAPSVYSLKGGQAPSSLQTNDS